MEQPSEQNINEWIASIIVEPYEHNGTVWFQVSMPTPPWDGLEADVINDVVDTTIPWRLYRCAVDQQGSEFIMKLQDAGRRDIARKAALIYMEAIANHG